MFANKVFLFFIVTITLVILVNSLETRYKHGHRGIHKHRTRHYHHHHHHSPHRHSIDDYPHSHHHHRTTRRSYNVGSSLGHRSRGFGGGFASSSSPKGDTYGLSTGSSAGGSRARRSQGESKERNYKKTISRRDGPQIIQKTISQGKEVQRKLNSRRNKW